MLEILQLTEAVLIATAVTISVVASPVAIINGEEPPDITPLIEVLNDES